MGLYIYLDEWKGGGKKKNKVPAVTISYNSSKALIN